MLDSEVLRDEGMLGAHVIVKRAFRERAGEFLVRWRRRLAVSEESGDYDEVLLGVERLVIPD